MSEIQIAERMARRRARVSIVFAAIFVTAQFASIPQLPGSGPQIMHLSAWVVWAATLLVFLVIGGGLWRGPRLRALLNDETTRDHRRRAFVLGFWTAIATAALCYIATWYEPFSAREAARLIITLAIAAALLRFGMLESRALKDD